ncbi:hypothetical protein PRIPAC_80703 [Pristionchus pacificus]|uniref:G protein-coupled receptor n=1 Tax=Pristionchus pacificus TaxID=54126 RepID=A0A2A6C2F3_PRIPA|nr:hypothetical protein PRIPAC_80703 [Pristionchus pacificus]|eukprot:PDM72412.1 G protein-coupled receptor [Pristionchus pacificus]
MADTVDVINAVVAYTCFCFAAVTVVINVLILKILYKERRFPYTSNYFYVIYMIGSAIDIFSLVANHTLAVLPSRGWFLPIFLSSTLPGRIWNTWIFRIIAVIIQLSGLVVGIFAATRDVYWIQVEGGGWYIQIIYYITYAYAFLMETNFEVENIEESDLRIFYIGYFIINDCYGGISPYLLLYFSKPVTRDFVRTFRFTRGKISPKSTVTETRA